MDSELTPQSINFQWYTTAAYPCSYLPSRAARSAIAVLAPKTVTASYDALIQRGFRRSGDFIYAPRCEACSECQAMRIEIAVFAPTRSQKRAAKALDAMRIALLPLHFSAEHFDLYQRYQNARHSETESTDLNEHGRAAYEAFLLKSPLHSELLELRSTQGQLLAVSVLDWVRDGVSAVYTFYEPNSGGSLGTSAVMCLIATARQTNLPFVYLGYWIADSKKMAYKSRFQPAQVYQAGQWQVLA